PLPAMNPDGSPTDFGMPEDEMRMRIAAYDSDGSFSIRTREAWDIAGEILSETARSQIVDRFRAGADPIEGRIQSSPPDEATLNDAIERLRRKYITPMGPEW